MLAQALEEKIKMDCTESQLQNARNFLSTEALRPKFTPLEEDVLRLFFSNTHARIFFMHSALPALIASTLPTSDASVLLSMNSRIKNIRGIRGQFVDSFLPLFLAEDIQETKDRFEGNSERFLKHYHIASLADFVRYSPETAHAYDRFRNAMRIDPDYLYKFAATRKTAVFHNTYLGYGHNSIARMGSVSLCLENISLLAAKSAEWTRPGSGYIELSTRYVDMSGKECYPVAREIGEYGVDPELVEECLNYSFQLYRHFQGENFSGPFPQFLRAHHGDLFPDKKDMERGIIGETCDVLGNFLPSATLTSVGIAISGEAFPELLKHLILDGTPENLVLARMIEKEAAKIGGDQFLRHFEPSEWKKASWAYLDPEEFNYGRMGDLRQSRILEPIIVEDEIARRNLWASFHKQPPFSQMHSRKFDTILEKLKETPRGEFDKLPNHFETVSAAFYGVMTFRGWRDLQRQQFCTHFRTYVTPLLGFYHYDKPAPQEFFQACRDVWQKNAALYKTMKTRGVPDALMQYPLAMGNLVGFEIGGNLAQMEFCNWQRTKWSVNHEVRQIFLGIDLLLRRVYPWWHEISRADTTPAYIFARTRAGVPLKKD